MHGFPGHIFRRAQTVTRQHTFVKSSEFFDEQRLHITLFRLRHLCSHCLPNLAERINLRMPDDLAQGFFDEVTPGQA